MAYTQQWGVNRESSNDSISAGKAWQKMKSGYLKKPGGEKEWNIEKNEFYYDTDKKKLKLVPTDDGEIPIKGFKSNLKKWQLPPERHTSKSTDEEEVYNMTPNATEEESKAVRDKFDRTYMKSNEPYNEVNVQDLQDMGEIKENKKGKYVVNENPQTSRDTLYIPKGGGFKSYTGKNFKVGSLIDESDYEDIVKKINKK